YYYEPEHDLVAGEPLAIAFAQARADATALAAVTARADATDALLEARHERWQHRVEARGPLLPGEGVSLAGVFREYVPARGGYAYLDAEFGLPRGSRVAVGPALATTGEGTVARAILGERVPLAAIVLADAAYEGATIGFVPYP
ncbi:MAG TPA: hypothetical protein VM582_00230, partial [Candidatus Thermoplasmatota archaeon]|nr:hypothetical protein [Candidatus Thermoplasmatota archaeon]